jgi:hypothetical protein
MIQTLRALLNRALRFAFLLESFSTALFAFAVAAWLAYLLSVLFGLLVQPLATELQSVLSLGSGVFFALWARLRRRTKQEKIWQSYFEDLDRSGSEPLRKATEQLFHMQPLLSSAFRLTAREELLRAWQDLPSALNPLQQSVLLELLESSEANEAVGRDQVLLQRLTRLAKWEQAWRLLVAWNRSEARGGAIESSLLQELCSKLRCDFLPWRRARALPLLFRVARTQDVNTIALLGQLLKSGHIHKRQIPDDLRPLCIEEVLPKPSGAFGGQKKILGSLTSLANSVQGATLAARSRALLRKLFQGAWSLLKTSPSVIAHFAQLAFKSAPKAFYTLSLVVLCVGVLWVGFRRVDFSSDEQVGAVVVPNSQFAEGDWPNGFTIQTMATRDSSLAAENCAELQALGFWSYYLVPREGRKWYRVRLGHFRLRADADSLASALKEAAVIEDYYLANFQTGEARREH